MNMRSIAAYTAILCLVLGPTGCKNDDETGSGTDVGASDSATGDAIADGSADEPDIAVPDGTPDGGECPGEPRSCTQLMTSTQCGDVAMDEVCVDGAYRCPDGFVLECPTNPEGCPLAGDFSMDGTSCHVPEEEICSYRGDSGTVPCPGNLFDCRCSDGRWSCSCSM